MCSTLICPHMNVCTCRRNPNPVPRVCFCLCANQPVNGRCFYAKAIQACPIRFYRILHVSTATNTTNERTSFFYHKVQTLTSLYLFCDNYKLLATAL